MLKKLWAYTKDFRLQTILTPIVVALECAVEIVVPLLMSKFVDKGIDAGNVPYMWKMGGLILLCIAMGLFLGVISVRLSAISSCGFARSLRNAQYEHIQSFSFANIDKFTTASLVTRLTTDMTNLQMAFMMLTRMAVRAPLNMALSIVMAFLISPKLSIVFVAALPIMLVFMMLLASKVHPIFRRVFERYDRLNTVVQENLRGIRIVKSFVRGDFENKKFSETTESIKEVSTLGEKILSWNHPALQFCMFTCQLIICYVGARMIVFGSLTPGSLMSLFSYVISCLTSLHMLNMLWVMLTMARASGERVVEVLSEKSTLTNNEHAVTGVKDGSIRFEDVSFGYFEGRDILKHNNIEIPSGSTVGIIGGTGSGKTSLAQLIPRLYDVTGGTVYVGGVDVRDYDITSLRDQVAVVLQKNVLFSGTIRSNLLWGKADATQEELDRACSLAQAEEFISKLPAGYDTPVEHGGANFSGGQKQRLCIARSLLKKPKILILDDSTSAVDTRTDALIRKAMAEEIPGTTKLIIAQRISSVMDSDIIMVLDNGRLVDHGNHEELMAHCKIYREVYNSQQKGENRIAG